jgi:hypothetical protein
MIESGLMRISEELARDARKKGSQSSVDGVGFFPTLPSRGMIALATGCHKRDVSNVLNKRYDKVGKQRRKLILDYLEVHGYIRRRKRKFHIRACRRHTPASWA